MPGIWRKTDLFPIQDNVIEVVGTDRTGVVHALSGFIQATQFIDEICPCFGTCGPPERGRVSLRGVTGTGHTGGSGLDGIRRHGRGGGVLGERDWSDAIDSAVQQNHEADGSNHGNLTTGDGKGSGSLHVMPIVGWERATNQENLRHT